MKKILVAGALWATLGAVSVFADDWTKDDFVKLWNDARKAIAAGDLARWNELTVPAKRTPDRPMTAEDFAQAKEFLLEAYPDMNSIKFLKFERKASQALFVLQTYLDDANYVTLDSFKFILVGKNWKVSGHVGGVSFPKTDLTDGKAADIAKRIEKELASNPDLQLSSEQASAGDAATRAAPEK